MAESDQSSQAPGSTPDSPPPPPVPASDPRLFSAGPATTPGLVPTTASDYNDVPSPRLVSLADDIFGVTPLEALQLLGAGVEALVRITGDIPPTPPPPGPEIGPTNMRGMQAEKENIVRTLSNNSLARLREEAEADDARWRKEAVSTIADEAWGATPPRDTGDACTSNVSDAGSTPAYQQQQPSPPPSTPSRSRMPPTPPPARPLQMKVDGVHLRVASPKRPDQTAALSSTAAEPYIVIGANSQPLNVQHSAITRKFYSKKAPPISISEYLLRLHRFCPMSTGVYLATSLYIYRLAVAEKAIAVTRRNAHRLLLAGLRVAMKALEDLSYAHTKMALVGGVTEMELARLEINFCFLVGFELAVHSKDMQQHWMLMKSGRAVGSLDFDGTAAVVASMDRMRIPSQANTVDPNQA